MTETTGVGLAEAIRELRAELLTAQAESAGEGVLFELGPVEMEFAVTLSRGGDANAGVRIGVVTLGASGKLSKDSVHRVKFVLTPKDAQTGDALEIAAQMDSVPER